MPVGGSFDDDHFVVTVPDVFRSELGGVDTRNRVPRQDVLDVHTHETGREVINHYEQPSRMKGRFDRFGYHCRGYLTLPRVG